MSVIAKWRDQLFEVSPTRITALRDLSFGYELNADTAKDAEGAPQTNQRGLKPFSISGSVTLMAAAGVDVRREIAVWRDLVTKAGYVYLGGKPLGPIVQLTKVSVSGVQLDDSGQMLTANLGLSFSEYDRATAVVVDNSAYALGASPDEKEEKRAENPGLSAAETVKMGVGARVKIVADTYAGGGTIPSSIKDSAHVISRIDGEKALLGYPDGICSWVRLDGLTLV